METFAEARQRELDSLAREIQNLDFLSAQLMINNGSASIANCIYLIEQNELIITAAEKASGLCTAFAQTLARNGILIDDRKKDIENSLRQRAMVAIEDLKAAIAAAGPSIEARHLGLA